MTCIISNKSKCIQGVYFILTTHCVLSNVQTVSMECPAPGASLPRQRVSFLLHCIAHHRLYSVTAFLMGSSSLSVFRFGCIQGCDSKLWAGDVESQTEETSPISFKGIIWKKRQFPDNCKFDLFKMILHYFKREI